MKLPKKRLRQIAEDWSTGPSSALAAFARGELHHLPNGQQRLVEEILKAMSIAKEAGIDTSELFELRLSIGK